jgi:hypothetical protein
MRCARADQERLVLFVLGTRTATAGVLVLRSGRRLSYTTESWFESRLVSVSLRF